MKFWVGGTLVSLAGVVVARIVAPNFSGDPALMIGVYIVGITLGLAGLVLITFGMKKVYRNVEAELAAGKDDSN